MPTPELNRIIREQAEDLYETHRHLDEAEVYSYYPPQTPAERDRFGIAYSTLDGLVFGTGDCDFRFPLQSLSKVFTYGLVLNACGRAETRTRVGVEPSGDAFNSFVFDTRHNRPYNPMVNAGALVVANMLPGDSVDEKVDGVLECLRIFAANPDLHVDEDTLEGQMQNTDRNIGLCFLMRSLGMIHGDVREVITTYLSICSVKVATTDLSTMAATLANGGLNPITGQRALDPECVQDLLSVMYTCGMYDAAGEWAFDVGFPAKSGVSGGIMFCLPDNFGGAVFSPGLDYHGNSVRGIRVCRDMSERYGLHLFSDPGAERLGLTAAEWVEAGRRRRHDAKGLPSRR